MFPEASNQKYAAKSGTTYYINTGWDPQVTGILPCWDGGKAIAGFGKTSGTVVKAWVMKMFGTQGQSSKGCGTAPQTITGYVKMIPQLYSDKTASTDCTLTSNAAVQVAWTTNGTTGNAVASYANFGTSEVYLALAEDMRGSGNANTTNLPVIWAVGG